MEPAAPARALAAVQGLIGGDNAPSEAIPGSDGAAASKVVPAPALPDPLTPEGRRGPLSGSDWGGYRIGDLVGMGGMGEVYRAVQRSVGRVVALKVLPPGSSEDPQRRQRFALEARAAARLRSPQVVAVYDSGEHEDRLWLAMEFISGPSLADELRRRRQSGERFAPLEAIDLILQAAQGLAVAHAERLVHRDIKPGNLLLDGNGRLKVADFGLVRFLDEHSLTVTGTTLGTPQYLAPEQGRGLATDVRGDIYSLGVVFYELLTMQPPFTGRSAEEVISRHNFTEPELPSTLNPDVPHDLQAVCLKCLQKDPEQRFANAGELIADLERQRAGLAPLVAVFEPGRPTTGAEEALRRLAGWRRRWWPLTIALVLTLCVLAAAWWWWDARKTTQAELRARLAPLAQAAPVPATAEDDLAALTRLAGDNDPQVVQGRGKLARIALLTTRLDAAAAVIDPGPEARQRWAADLAELGEQLGQGDPRLDRHRAALAAAEARVATLRTRLAPLATASSVPATAEDDLAELSRLAGGSDPQVVQGRDKLARIALLTSRLDAAAAVADPGPEARQHWAADLADLGEQVGQGDARFERHRAALAAAETRIATLRARLASRLAGNGFVGPTLRAVVLPDLDLLARLAGEHDRDLDEWRARLARSQAAIDADRAILARLDRPEPIPAAAMPALVASSARLAGLLGDTDPLLQRWSVQLAELTQLATRFASWPERRVIDAETLASDRTALARWNVLHGDPAQAAVAKARLDALAGPPAPAWATAHGHDRCGPWLELRVGEVVQRLRWLSPGSWPVGSAADEIGHEADETQALVTSEGLWVAEGECSQALWLAVMGTQPARWRDPICPVEQVSRRDVETFCQRLAHLLPGCRVRLPAEAEWEAAVRAGTLGPWAGLDRAHAAAVVIHADSGSNHPAPAAQGQANRLGIRDGAGNLWEWCRDDWGPAPGNGPAVARVSGSGTGTVRGGSWVDALELCRPANRAALAVDARSPYVGFRMVVEP